MDRSDFHSDDRAQAFTLEGFISAIVVLTAVLFALQAVVIMPTSGGAVDRSALAQEEQEVRDVLVIAGENGNLSELVRNWDSTEGEWRDAGASGEAPYNSTQFAEMSEFGRILDERFVNSSGKSYNVDFVVTDGDDRHVEPIVRMGGGTGDSVVSASYTVTLHEDQELTEATYPGFTTTGTTLADAESQGYPIPSTSASDPGSVYAVVEVRVTVW